MKKIGVIGNSDSIKGFAALGLEVYPVSGAEEARTVLHRLSREEVAIIYMTEQLAAGLSAEITRYRDALTPAIILIPGKEGSLGLGMQNVKTTVERAVGADII